MTGLQLFIIKFHRVSSA